jgi:hypothetical protein
MNSLPLSAELLQSSSSSLMWWTMLLVWRWFNFATGIFLDWGYGELASKDSNDQRWDGTAVALSAYSSC